MNLLFVIDTSISWLQLSYLENFIVWILLGCSIINVDTIFNMITISVRVHWNVSKIVFF